MGVEVVNILFYSLIHWCVIEMFAAYFSAECSFSPVQTCFCCLYSYVISHLLCSPLRVRCSVMAKSVTLFPHIKCDVGEQEGYPWRWWPELGTFEAVKLPGEGTAQLHRMAARLPGPCQHMHV